MSADLAARAVRSWLDSPVTSLVVRWLMPDVGALVDDLTGDHLDALEARRCAG